MIKIPGTDEGLPAIEQALYEGININVTLLFRSSQYAKVIDAFIAAMERRLRRGQAGSTSTPSRRSSSRASTPRSTSAWRRSGSTDARRARPALANARAAYQRYLEGLQGRALRASCASAGAPVQRPLWASTGRQEPEAYSDVAVRRRAGRAGHRQHDADGDAAGRRRPRRGHRAERVTIDPTRDLEALADAGIDLDDVTDKLLRDGIEAFVTPMEKLLEGIETKRKACVTWPARDDRRVDPDDLRAGDRRAPARAPPRSVARGSGARTTRSGARRASPRSPTGSAG